MLDRIRMVLGRDAQDAPERGSALVTILVVCGVTLWCCIFLVIVIVIVDIADMLSSGLSEASIGLSFFALSAPIVGLAEVMPGLRDMFRESTWLYPLTQIALMDLLVLSIPELILTKGFEVLSTPRHVATIILAALAFLVLRGAMSWWLWRHPMLWSARRGTDEIGG